MIRREVQMVYNGGVGVGIRGLRNVWAKCMLRGVRSDVMGSTLLKGTREPRGPAFAHEWRKRAKGGGAALCGRKGGRRASVGKKWGVLLLRVCY